ncbi:MAG: DUF3048 domain-containing protein [Actinobacteria bacterium]|nr:DUF3048 domain-containing protein [Actinomycetota bacterium]
MRPTRALPLVVALGLALAACGGDAAKTTTTTAPTTTTTSTTTTTTTVPETTTTSSTSTTSTTTTTVYDGPVAPLTGLAIDDADLAARRVMAVKVDNHPDARPQSGIDRADAVMEILVEGGFTRFVALFHTTDTDYVGPIRSLRPTDSTVLLPMNAVAVISGGQPWILGLTADRGIRMIGEVAGTYRISSRPQPHNLYGDTEALRDTADGRGYSDEFGTMLYDIAPWDEMPTEEATAITFNWANNTTIYSWRYEDGRYYRSIGTENPIAHMVTDRDGTTRQVSAEVLVVIEGTRYLARPAAGIDGNKVPAIDTVGSGPVEIFYDGVVKTGTWHRDRYRDPFTFTDEDGAPLTVPPGHPWISIFPEQNSVDW